MRKHILSEAFLFSILFVFFTGCRESTDDPITPTLPQYDWEGESGKYNEPYRDSILFNSDRYLGTSFAPSVYMMYKDGSGINARTTQWFTFAATWSPRKWKIFYIADTSFGESARGLYVMNGDGSNKRRITPPSEDVWGVSCSPDDKKLAYIVLDTAGQGKIRITNPDGSNAHDITGFFGPQTFHTVSWSSDSRHIVFDGHTTGIGIVNADGSGFGTLFAYSYQCWDPDWSPDGSKIAFVSFAHPDSSYYANIFYYEVGTRRIYQVTHTRAFDQGPHWSPDSKEIIFSSRLPGLDSPDHLYLVNVAGSDVLRW
jgi:Tol biopolymer transport system component